MDVRNSVSMSTMVGREAITSIVLSMSDVDVATGGVIADVMGLLIARSASQP